MEMVWDFPRVSEDCCETPTTHTPCREERGGAAWCYPDEGLGANGTDHIKRGKQRWGGSLGLLPSSYPRLPGIYRGEQHLPFSLELSMTELLPSLLLAESPSPTDWITGRRCSGNVCCIERKPQLVQSLDNSPDVGPVGGAWMETE